MTGPLLVQLIETSDVSAPGAGQFVSFVQIDNHTGKLKVQQPGADADGSGLTKLRHRKWAMLAGNDPLVATSWDQVVASGATITTAALTDADANVVSEEDAAVLDAGQAQTLYMAWDDDE